MNAPAPCPGNCWRLRGAGQMHGTYHRDRAEAAREATRRRERGVP